VILIETLAPEWLPKKIKGVLEKGVGRRGNGVLCGFCRKFIIHRYACLQIVVGAVLGKK